MKTVKERLEYFRELTEGIIPSGMEEWLLKNGFFTAPASANHHGNYEGGLFDHSVVVCHKLCSMTEKLHLEWQNPNSPVIVAMFHDLCKIDEYTFDYEGAVFRNNNQTLKGHGDKSVMLLSQFMTLTEEEIFCIRYHMGAYITDDWDAFGRAVERYQNVLWTHAADMFASKVLGV